MCKEINTLENKVFRFECEKTKWQQFRKLVEEFRQNYKVFGFNTDKEKQELDEMLESIKYY